MNFGKALESLIVRQSLQAGLSVALSIAFGSLISGRRWYWAAIAAFIVGSGVGSRDEALVKALQRIGGTLGGLIAGVFLASAVSGHTDLALALVLVCVFFAFYAFQTAYGTMIFFITLMLALLYGLLGQFQPSLLVLRLEETALGAVISIGVTSFVLPIKQGDQFRRAAHEFLAALAETVRLASEEQPEEARASARAMQSKLQALRNSVGTLKRGWGFFAPLQHRLAVRAALRCAYLAREFVEQDEAGRFGSGQVLVTIERVRTSTASPANPQRDGDESEPHPRADTEAGQDPAAQVPTAQVSSTLVDALCQFGRHLQ